MVASAFSRFRTQRALERCPGVGDLLRARIGLLDSTVTSMQNAIRSREKVLRGRAWKLDTSVEDKEREGGEARA